MAARLSSMTGFLGEAISGGWSIRPANLAQATTANLANLLATYFLEKKQYINKSLIAIAVLGELLSKIFRFQ